MRQMYNFGADEVIPDEFGSSVEIFTRVLRKYQIPTEELAKIISAMRMDGYEMLRLLFKEPTTLSDLQIALTDVSIETVLVAPNPAIVGKTLGEIDLRKDFGITALLIKRGEEAITELDSQTQLVANDVAVLIGTHDKILRVNAVFKGS